MDARKRLEIATRAVVLNAQVERANVEWTLAVERLMKTTSRDALAVMKAAEVQRDRVNQQCDAFIDELRALGVYEEVRGRVVVFDDQTKTLAEWVGISENGMRRALAAALAEAGVDASDHQLLMHTKAEP